MNALVFYEHGGLDKLTIADVPRPTPGPGQVLVQVRACALNHLDLWVLAEDRFEVPLPHTLGADAAGIVAELGDGASSVQPGVRCSVDPGISRTVDEYTRRGLHSVSPGYGIIAEHWPGMCAEYAVVPAENVVPLPDHVPFTVAAAAGLVFLTAWRMLIHRAAIRAGETVLIVGAGGGVNTAALQIARHAGCRVYATTSTAEKAEALGQMGAAAVVNYREHSDWAGKILDMTSGRGVDVVVDNVGSATWEGTIRAVARGGRVVVVGRTSGTNTDLNLRHLYGKQISILGSTMGSHQDYRDVMRLVSDGPFTPTIDRVLPLDRGVEAMGVLSRGEQFGKIVLEPGR